VRAACGTAKPVPFVHQHNSKLGAIQTAADQQKQPDFALPRFITLGGPCNKFVISRRRLAVKSCGFPTSVAALSLG
jgi:hypothetical protein